MLFSSVIGIVIGLIRALIDLKKIEQDAVTIIKTMFTSLLAAELVSLGIFDFSIGLHSKVALTGICAYVANDILLGIRKTAQLLSQNPVEFARSIMELIRGGHRGQSMPPPPIIEQKKEP